MYGVYVICFFTQMLGVMFSVSSCATPPGTCRRGTLYILYSTYMNMIYLVLLLDTFFCRFFILFVDMISLKKKQLINSHYE